MKSSHLFDSSVIHHIEHADHTTLGEDVEIVFEQLHLDPSFRDGHKLIVLHTTILITRPDADTVCGVASDNQMILQEATHHVLTVGQKEWSLEVSRCQNQSLSSSREALAEHQKLRLTSDVALTYLV